MSLSNSAEVRLLPAISGSFAFMSKMHSRSWKGIKGKDMCWWTKNAIFRYPYMLVSYGICSERSKFEGGSHNWRTENEVPDDVFILTDSGGYQIWSKGMKVEPIEVFNWQERNSDAAIGLDVPPRGYGEEITDEEFKSAAEKTKENIEAIEERASSSELDFYNPLHGANKRELDIWWEKCIEPFPFDKIAYGPKPTIPRNCGLGLGYLLDKSVRDVHLFMVSGLKTILLCNYAGELGFDSIYYDSSTFTKMIGYAQIFTPYLDKVPSGRRGEKKEYDYSRHFCMCPVCKLAEKNEVRYGRNDLISVMFMYMHNLWIQIEYQKFCSWLVKNEKEMFKFIEKKKWKDVENSIEFLKKVKEDGFDSAYSKKFEKKGGLGKYL